jgi:rhodanese-related sulfurtransferase
MTFSLFCCAQKPKFISYSPADFEQFLKETADVQLVDVRRPDEFNAGYIDKAILINVQEADFIKQANSLLDKSKPVAV